MCGVDEENGITVISLTPLIKMSLTRNDIRIWASRPELEGV